jgi:hypothetical protein
MYHRPFSHKSCSKNGPSRLWHDDMDHNVLPLHTPVWFGLPFIHVVQRPGHVPKPSMRDVGTRLFEKDIFRPFGRRKSEIGRWWFHIDLLQTYNTKTLQLVYVYCFCFCFLKFGLIKCEDVLTVYLPSRCCCRIWYLGIGFSQAAK